MSGTAVRFVSKLRGFFNVYNMTALIAGAAAAGFDAAAIQAAFDRVTVVDGRMDRVPLDMPFTVVVDYAHTPDALVNICSTAREITPGRLLCVFGCGGDRDRTKRPRMGEAVARWCDEAWVTSDNPRSEEPRAIIDEIIAGIPLDFPFQSDPDRRRAIEKAMRAAWPGDCIVVAGKGHETYQEIKGVKHHFDDRETVADIGAVLRGESGNHAAS
jgi:UDP-N-acetylmuramoyl-L-alanyl-D-glutamate--2,6-diaminopimelate ligase